MLHKNDPIQRHNHCLNLKLFLSLFITLLCLCFFTQKAYSGSVTLTWDPNSPDENIVGYKLYYGNESRNYTAVIDINNGTLTKVKKLVKGMSYYFAITAYNDEGQESDFSEELMINTCTFKLSPSKRKLKPEGGISTAKVITQTNCEWTTTSGAEWLDVMDGHNGTGPGVITFLVEPKPTPEKRVAVSSFGGKTFTVSQKGSTIP